MLSHFSHVRLFATLWTTALQAPLSMRQEYWRGSPCPPPGDLPHLGTEPGSRKSTALACGLFTPPAPPGLGAVAAAAAAAKSLQSCPTLCDP